MKQPDTKKAYVLIISVVLFLGIVAVWMRFNPTQPIEGEQNFLKEVGEDISENIAPAVNTMIKGTRSQLETLAEEVSIPTSTSSTTSKSE